MIQGLNVQTAGTLTTGLVLLFLGAILIGLV